MSGKRNYTHFKLFENSLLATEINMRVCVCVYLPGGELQEAREALARADSSSSDSEDENNSKKKKDQDKPTEEVFYLHTILNISLYHHQPEDVHCWT